MLWIQRLCRVHTKDRNLKDIRNAISSDVAIGAAHGDGAGGCQRYGGNTISQTNAWTPRLAMSIKLIKHTAGERERSPATQALPLHPY